MKSVVAGCKTRTNDMRAYLSASEEMTLCRRWHDHHDAAAAERLIESQRHLVAGVATLHSDFGVLTQELIGEGFVGLMHAICRYDPSCGASFSSYAALWVRTAIQQSILRASPSMCAETADSNTSLPPLYACISRQRASARFAQ